MDALKVGVSVQAALSGVADVTAVAADKATADPTNAKEEGFARGEALSLLSSLLVTVGDYDSSRQRGQPEGALRYLRGGQAASQNRRHLKSPSKPSDQRMKAGEQ